MERQNERDALVDVIHGILDAGKAQRDHWYSCIESKDSVVEAVEAIKAGDIDKFTYGFMFSMDEAIASVIEAGTDNSEAMFLFRHTGFVQRHFENLIEVYEGSPCSADKSSTIIKALAGYFLTGKEIEFNYEGEYTYHLPEKLFKEHGLILAFFKGLRALYYGQPNNYLLELKAITELAAKD